MSRKRFPVLELKNMLTNGVNVILQLVGNTSGHIQFLEIQLTVLEHE